ncbi:MAG: beta strand repeat-containing protein [Isosphaerales bacterium]
MSDKWKRPFGSKRAKSTGARPRSSANRPRRKSPYLVIQELEHRTLLSVTASLNATVLDVNLSAANDQAMITPSGSNIQVSGTGYSSNSFAGVTAIVVLGANTSSQDDPNQGVTFGGSGGTITLHSASGTDALKVTGITAVTFTDVTIDATSGNIDVEVSETTSATGVLGATAPQVSVSVTGATITADNITLDANASSTYTNSAPLGGVLNALGAAVAIADLEPSATVTVQGSSTKITVNGASGNVTIGADASATVNSTTTVGKDISGNALNPVDAAIAASIVNSSAVTHVGGGSTVSAGSGTGTLSITSINTTNVTTEVDGSSALGGASAAVTLDNSTSQAFVDGGSTATGGTVDVSATTTNTANTTANSTATGGGANSAIQNILAGKVDPAYLSDVNPPSPKPADKTSPAETASSGGLPLTVSGAVAVTKFTPTTQAYVDSSTVTAGNAINIDASSNNNTSTVADANATTSNANVSVGVAVAISDTDVSNTATVENTAGTTSLSAPTIMVQAATPTMSSSTPNILNTTASATSGVSGSNVGVAGALALNIVSNTSEASVPTGSTVSMAGNVTFNAQDNATETASAQPPVGAVGGSGGGALGIGASVALNIAGNTTLADLQDTAQLTGANNLTFTAGSTDTVATNAVSGSSGGSVSISPSVGITVVTNTTAAQVGAPDAANDPLVVGGAFSATATHTGLASTPTGAASGAGTAVSAGVSIALAFVTDQTTATTLRSLDAKGGGVTLEADGSAASLVSSDASASGGPTASQEKSENSPPTSDTSEEGPGSDTSDSTSVDGQNAQQRHYADSESTVTDSKGNTVSAGDTKKKSATPAAKTSDGGVTVAAAVAINIVDSEADATVPAGLTITATGPLTVTATNDTGNSANTIYGDTANAWGTAAGTSKVGIGAAVAVNLVKASTEATIGASTINTDGVNVNAGMTVANPMNAFGATATSGAGAGDIGVAGSVAINIVNDTSQALIETGAAVAANGGDVSLTSANNSTDTTLALPAGVATGDSVGIGASLALNIITDTTQSEVQDGAALTNTGNVTVTASASHSIITWAQNGAAGKVAVGAGISIVIAGDQTTAYIGSDAQTLNASGGLTIGASGSFSVGSLADSTAATNGGTVGVGASVVVNVAQDSFLAELNRNVSAAGPIMITDAATGSSQATAIASENGAPPSSSNTDTGGSDGTADQESSNQSTFAHGEGGSDSPNVAAPPTSNSEMSSPSSSASGKSGGSSGESKVGIAAAVSVNVLTTSTVAEIENGLTVTTTSGALTVGTTNQTSALALADGRATSNKVSIGAAVSLNVANVTNDATIGSSATISAHGVNVTALMTTGQVNDFSTQGLGVAIGSQVGVAGSVGINVITINTQASIGAGTVVKSFGGLSVQAANDETLQNIAFTLAVGQDAGVGAAVNVNVLNNPTNAFLDSNVQANVADVTQVTAESSLNPSMDPIPNSVADTIVATGTLTAGSDEVTGIDASIVNGTMTPFVGEPVTGTGIPFGTVIVKNDSKPFTGILTFGSNVVTSDDTVFLDPLKTPKVGETVSGPGIVPGATIQKITLSMSGGTSITLSAPVFANGSAPLAAGSLQLSANATASGPVIITETPVSIVTTALSSLHPTNFAAGAGASSGGAGVAGSFIVNVITQTTHAYINGSALINTKVGTAGYPTAKSDEGVTVAATETMNIADWAGAIGGGDDAGIGAALDVNIVTEDAQAYIAPNATVDAAQNVMVTSSTNGTFNSITAALAVGGSAGIAGAASIEILSPTTNAYIDTGTTVDAQGDLLVQASRQATINTLAGQLGVSGDASVGAAVSTVVDTVNTDAYIGSGDMITAQGTSGTIPVLTGNSAGDTTPFSGVAVVAATFQNVQSIVVGGAISGSVGIAGSIAVNVLSDTTLAYVAAGANLNATDGSPGSGPGVMVTAADPLTLFSTAGALAAGGDAGLGAGVDVDSITKNTQAYIATATVTADGDVLVQAKSAENLDSITAAIGASGSVAIVGSAGVYVLGITTRAFIGNDPTNQTAGSTSVQAGGSILVAASEATTLDLLSGNFAGSGSVSVGAAASVPVINKTTEAFIGAGAHVGALGLGSAINAENGQFAISYQAYGSGAGVAQPKPESATPGGHSLNSPRLGQDRVATPLSQSVNGLAVTAVNTDALQGVGVTGGASGAVAVNLSGSVAVLTNHTDAYIGSGAAINSSNAGAASGQSVLVAAGNDASFLGIAASLSISGTVAVAPGVVVLVINNTTTASIDDGASVAARGDVAVVAHSSGDVLTIAAAAAVSGEGSGGGSVSYIGINDTTQANIGNTATSDGAGAQVNAGGNVLVDATDDTVAYLITGALSIGIGGAGIGAAVGIVDLSKNTDAFIGSHATVNALGNTPSLPGIFDGNYTGSGDFETLSSFHGVAVQAATSENVTNVSAAGAAGFFAGLAGGVSIELFSSTTQADVGNSAHINANSVGAGSAQAVDVAAVNQATNFSFAGGLGGGIAGIAGGVDVGLLKNSTQAYISNGSDVHAKQDVDVYALSNDSVQTDALGAAVGIVGVAGSVSVWSIGQPYAAGYTDGNASDGTTQSVPNSGVTNSSSSAEGQTGGASSMVGGLTDPMNNGAAGNTQYISGTVSSDQGGVNGSISGDPVASAINSTAVPAGTVAFIGSGVSVSAGGNVNVRAKSEVSYSGFVGGLAAGAVGIGGAVEIANIEGSTQAYIDASSTVNAGGNVAVDAELVSDTSNGTAFAGTAGIVAIGAQVVDIQDSSTESATLNSGVTIPQAAQVQVTASSNRSLTALALGGSVGGVAAGVGVAIANASGGPSAGIGSGAQIGQTGTVGGLSVAATSTDDVMAKSYGVAAGYVGLTGVYASAESNPTVAASLGTSSGTNARVNVTGTISVGATSTGQASGNALGIAVSETASLGAAVANAQVSPDTTAEIGGHAVLQAGQDITLSALNNITSGGTPQNDGADTMALAGAGAIVVGAAGAGATSTTSPTVDAGVASGASLSAGNNVSIVSQSHDHAGSQAIGAGLGIVGVGISVATATDGEMTKAHSDLNVNLTAGNNISVTANGVDDASAKSVAAAGGIVSGDGGDATATINPTISATTAGGGKLSAPATITVAATLTPQSSANVVGVAAGALAVGASVANATDSPAVTATVGGAGTKITGGTLNVDAATYVPVGNDSASSSASGSAGALIGVAATSSTANNTGTLTSSIANQTALFISSGITVQANGNTDQYAIGNSDVGGIIAVGSNTSTAESTAQTNATVGSGVTISAGDAIGGLTDGQIYYVVPSSNPNLISLASSFQNAIQTSGGAHPQPGSGAITIPLSVPAFSAGNQSLTPYNGVGAAPVLFDPATAVNAGAGTINLGSNSLYLGEPVVYHKSNGPALAISANGDDVNFGAAVSGSGGLVAGSAAAANTSTGGGASASIADNSGPGTSLHVSSLTITALHTAQFDSQTNTIQADAVGFSGSAANNTDSSTVSAHIGNYAQVVTQSLQVLATNTTEKNLVPAGQNNVSAGSGGVIQGNAAQSTTTIANFTTADVGAHANLNVTGSTTNPGLFELYALNNVDGSDTVKLDTGGLIDGSDATSIIHADTNNATAEIGPSATVTTVGDVNLDTRTTSNFTVAPTVHTYGLASPGSIDGEATISENDAVKVDSGATVQAQGNLNLNAGGDMAGDLNDLTTGSNSYELNASAIPAFELTSKCEIDQNNTVNVASGALLQAAGNANLMAQKYGNAITNAFGTGKDWLTAVAGALGSLFGGTGLSASTHTGTGILNTTTTVTVNGTIQLGINNVQSLTINKTLNLNNTVPVPTDYSVTGPISFTVDTESLASDLFQELQTLQALLVAYAGDTAAENAYQSDLQQIQFQMTQLGLSETDGGTTFYKTQDAVPFVTVSPIFAEAGTITIDGDNLLGSGSLQAPGNVSITITNNSPAFLRLNAITIPQSFGGTLFYDGSTVTTNSGIGGINQSKTTPSFSITTSNTSSPPSVTITNTFSSKDPENIGSSQTANLTAGSESVTGLNTAGFFVGETVSAPGAGIPAGTTIAQINSSSSITLSQNATITGSFSVSFNTFDGVNFTSPDINIDGPITAPPTVLTISSQGSVVVNATIDVGTVTITAGANFIQSYVPGIDSIAGDPATLWSNVSSQTEANAAAANPNPPLGNSVSTANSSGASLLPAVAADLANPGAGNIMVGNDVFISAQFLNVDGTIQSGQPYQQVTIDSTVKTVYNPDIKGMTWTESMTQAITAAATAYLDWKNGDHADAQSLVSSHGLFTNDYLEFLLPEGTADNIYVYYEGQTGQLALGQTDVQGGLVVLYGDLMSTGSGNLNVLDGYGAINVANNTSYPLVETGLSTGGGTAGELKITDTGKQNAQGQPLVTEYYRQNGQVYSQSYFAKPDGTVASVVSSPAQYSGPNAGARTASYQPAAARFVWEDGQDLSVTVTDNYQTSSWASIIHLNSSDLVSSTTHAGTPEPLLDGEWIDNAATDPSFQNLTPGTGIDSADYTYSFEQINTGTPTTQVSSSQNSTWYGTTTYYETTVTTTPKKNINVNSIRADRPINIDFIGFDEGSSQQKLSVSTEGDLLINGPIANAAGPTTLSSSGGSIEQENPGPSVGGQNITLSAANGIGGTTPVLLNMTNISPTNIPGTLNATSTNGNINLNDVSGSMKIGQITTSQGTGNVTLTADENILAANASSLVEGGAIALTASFGSAGSLGTGGTANAPAGDALPINVDVGTASVDSLKVTAQGDVYVKQTTGDLRLDKIASSSGNVRVEVPNGDLVDANNISVPDTQNLTLLEARWMSMLATQSTAQISINDTINAYESQIDQEYQTYWQFRNEQPNPSVFDPNFQVTLSPGQVAAWTTYYQGQGLTPTQVAAAITTLQNADTQEYRTFNATFGKLGNSFDPNYRYYANQTPLNVNSNLTFGASSLDVTGFLITLPGNGYSTGTPLVYHANGGSVAGLVDGGTYYAIAVASNPNQISLASSYANATAATPIPIHLSSITGTGNTLSEIFANPNVAFGASNIDGTGYLINLPGNAYTTGQAVVYHANGGSAAGLVDGGTYYAIVSSGNPNQISLASSYANATASTPVPIHLSPITGTGNTLSEIFQTFGASNISSGDSINLPQNVFNTGQAVIYHANGGSVGGLTDGGTYYVVVDPNNTGSSAYIGLASSSANATAAPPVLIQLTSVTGTGNYLSEVDVEAQRAAWSQSQLQNSMDLSIIEPVLFPSTVQAIPDPNFEGKNIAIVVSHSIGTVSGQDVIALPLSAALPQNEALDLAAAQPADIMFYNAGHVLTFPTDPSFNPVELTVTLEKGVSLENSGLVDATAGQNIELVSGQDVVNKGPLLPITIDHLTAQGGAMGHPTGVTRVLGLDGLVNGAASGINITSGNLFLEGGNTGGIGTSMAPLYIDLATGSLLEEANAQFDVDIVEKNGSLDLVTAFSAVGSVNLTADQSILNGNTFNNINVEAANINLLAGKDGDTTNTIGTGAAPLDIVLTGGSVVAQAYENIYLDATSGSLTAGGVHSLHGDLFLSAPFGSILEPASEPVGTAVAIGNNITLSADPLLGFIGSPTQAFEIDAIAPATLTASSGQNAYITQPLGDLYLKTVTVSNGGTAFIVVPDGNIDDGNPGGQNVLAGKTYLFASLNIGTSGSPISTQVGNVQGQSTTGSTWLINSGALSVGGVAPNNAMGMQSGGTINVVAQSPITIIQNVLALSTINYTSTHDATGGNTELASGVSIASTTSAVNFYTGDNFTEDADSKNPAAQTVVVAATSINIYGDYQNAAGPGAVITVNGELIAPNINIYENGADSVVNLNNPAGINNAAGGYPGKPAGLLTVTGGPGNNQLNVNDSADTKSQSGILTSTTITGLGIGGKGIVYTNIVNNQASQPFTFNLVVSLGTGNDVFSIQSTNAPTKTEVVNTGAAQDQFNVGSKSPPTGGGHTQGGIVDNIKGPLTIQGFGNDTTNVDDTGSTTAKTGTLTATSLTGLNMGSAGITYAGLSVLNISLGSGGNTFNINVAANQNLPAITTINGGSSNQDSLTAFWGGDFNGTLNLLGFESSAITITNNLNGSLSETFPGTVQSITIGGSITASGVLTVGSLNSMTIQHDLAGQLIVQSTLTSLTVHGGTPGTVVADQIGTIGVDAGYGPVVAQIQEAGIQRRIEAAVPGAPFPALLTPPAPTPAVSPAGITFQYFYEGLISPLAEGQNPSRNLANPQLTARVTNATGNKGPDQFDFSLITYNDTAKFNLVRLDATGNSGVSGIRNVAVEGDVLTAVTPAASAFFAPDPSPAGIYLPQDSLAGVGVRDYVPDKIINAKSIQAVAFGSRTRSNGQLETGSVASGSDAANLLAPGTAIVQAGSSNGTAVETFRVPFADLATQKVGFFMDDNAGAGGFDNNNVALVVQGVATANSSGTDNNVTPSNAARGAVVALITVAETFIQPKHPQNSVIQTIGLRGDGGSIQTQQQIGSSNNNFQPYAPFTPSITSTGPLGDVILQGPLPNVTAPSIFGSLLPGGPIPATSTVQTTGIRTDPITSATSQVPADLGRVYVVTTPQGSVVTATLVQANGPGLAGQILCGGNLISQVVSNGTTTGMITVQPVAWEPGSGNLGTTFTYASPSGQVLHLGGFISTGSMTAPTVSVGNSAGTTSVSGLMQGGTVTTYGSVIGNIAIGGPMSGPTVSAGSNGTVLNLNGTLQGGFITTYGSVAGNITIGGPMNGPTIMAGNNRTVIKVDGPVQGGSITTSGSATGTIAINGPVNGPTVSAGANSATIVNVPVKGGSILTGGTLGNLTIGGPLSGQVVTIGNMNGTVTINGPVQNGVIATSGSINGNLTIGGPLSNGQILSVGNVSGNVTIKGPLQSGRIASLGSILGALMINGGIDSQSALVSGGSIGGLKGKLYVGNINGIVAAVGPIYVGQIGSTSQALYYKQNIPAADAAVVDAIFSQGLLSPLSPTDLFDHASLLDLENLSVILVNLNSLTVKNGKLQL